MVERKVRDVQKRKDDEAAYIRVVVEARSFPFEKCFKDGVNMSCLLISCYLGESN